MSPVHGALGRFGFGSLGLLVVMLWHRPWPKITPQQWPPLVAMGLFGVLFYNICFFNGLKTVPAGRASLVASMQPAFVYLFAVAVWGEKSKPIKVFGLVMSLLGAVLVISQGDLQRLFNHGLNSGDWWILGCAVSWVTYTLLGRTVTESMTGLAATAYSTWIGTAMLVAYGLYSPLPTAVWSGSVWASMLFLGFAGTTLAFLLYLNGIAQIGPSRASIFINLVPVFSVLLSAAVLGEAITAPTVIGGAIVIAGVRLLNR